MCVNDALRLVKGREMVKKDTSAKEKPQRKKTGTKKDDALKDEQEAQYKKAFTVVALGGSAGGLEAFETFFRSLPDTLNAAFVVISHLDPKHASMLSELIARFTKMKVNEAQDDIAVEPGSVYVIPPNRELSIYQGRLRLTGPKDTITLRMPIDYFLRSLADDQGERAVAIIMSGTGTDGTLGIRAVQAAGGVVFVQNPTDARYSGMPQSAIQTGVADYILAVKDMAGQLVALLEKGHAAVPEDQVPSDIVEVQKVLSVVRVKTGHDFSQYKKNTMNRRIRRRMNVTNMPSIDEYIGFLRGHPDEVDNLFKELLITVTSFFREPDAFDTLKRTILPDMLSNEPDDCTVRVWVPGCATGEEAYSLAILIREFAEETGRDYKVQMFATDIDEASIVQARAGLFPANIALDVTEHRLAKYFVKEPTGYRVRKDIRESIVFATQDVVKDAPFTRLDIVSCRNVLIYMEPELQGKVIGIFHYSLKTGGILFLGSSESVGNRTDVFRIIDKKWKLFQSKPGGTQALIGTPFPAWPPEHTRTGTPIQAPVRKTNIEETVHLALLAAFAPPAVIVNEKGDIIFIHGDTAKYLTPSPGRPALNIGQMTREGLRFSMRSALMAAASHGREAVYRNVEVKTNGNTEKIDLSIIPLARAEDEETLFMFTFQPVMQKEKPGTKGGMGLEVDKDRLAELERELIYTRESLEAAAEEAQAANEELKSANEELQSSNEELQSTNEELETSKEELQSVNEELTTVNSELRSKIEQLSQSESDIKNLLDSTEIATIFLDNDLRIKRFNSEASRIINLIASDVGRPIGDMTLNIDYPELADKARGVIATLHSFDLEVQGKDKSWYVMHIIPYRTLDNVIDGVVMTFTDITEVKQVMQERQQFIMDTVDVVREPFLVLDHDLKVVTANRKFLDFFQVTHQETEGRMIKNLGRREWDLPVLTDLLFNVIKSDKPVEDFRLQTNFRTIGRRTLLVNARRINPAGTMRDPLILVAMTDATDDTERQGGKNE